jgi:hypothetical protein
MMHGITPYGRGRSSSRRALKARIATATADRVLAGNAVLTEWAATGRGA